MAKRKAKPSGASGADAPGAPSSPPAAPEVLEERHRRFVLEFLATDNATESYRRVYGRNVKGAASSASTLLRHPKVAALLEEERSGRAARLRLNADNVLRELARLALFDPRDCFDADGRLLTVSEMPEDVRRAIVSFDVTIEYSGRGSEREAVGETTRVRLVNKQGAIDSAMKHLGLFPKEDPGMEAGLGALLGIAKALRDKKREAKR